MRVRLCAFNCKCACVLGCIYVCMYVCVREFVRVCVRACVCEGLNGVSLLIWITTDHIEHNASFIDVAFNTNHVDLR